MYKTILRRQTEYSFVPINRQSSQPTLMLRVGN